MRYKVHKFEINMNKDQERLEKFLNELNGELVAVIPNVTPTFRPMGATAQVNYLYIVEKVTKW